MKLYNDIELEFLNSYLDINEKDIRKKKDRNYEFVVFTGQQHNIINKLLNWFENTTGKKLKKKTYYLILHKYKTGDYFEKHIDELRIDDNNRAYVIGFHINDNYEGGDYKLYNPDLLIDKTPGVPYFFECSRLHEITKITKGNRKSAVMFINYEDLIVKNGLI